MMGIVACGLQQISLGLIARIADRVFVYDSPSGHSIELSLRQYGLSDGRIGRVNNGVDIREIDNVKPQRVPAGVVNIGAVRPSKGLYDVVSVWKIVAEKLPAQTLTIVGNMTAENHKHLMSAVETAGLKTKIILMGPQDHTSSLRILKEGRVYVSLSHEEGWGTSVCEALAAGLPVVAYDIPTIRYLFGDVVDLVPVGDYTAFAQKIMDVLSTNIRPTAKLRGAACAYSWDDVAEQDLKHMIEAMAEGRRSS
jgi:glycosyltransferase involved in cell wall biosynthesis